MILRSECTACFTGHRIIKENEKRDVIAGLYSSVLHLAAQGYTDFIAGGAIGFDTMAAECVVALKERYPTLRLTLALPCRDQTAHWKDGEALCAYKQMLGLADNVEYMQPFYTNSCMFERNRWMVEHSTVCVAYYRGGKGGTSYTFNFAKKTGLRIINLSVDNDC